MAKINQVSQIKTQHMRATKKMIGKAFKLQINVLERKLTVAEQILYSKINDFNGILKLLNGTL